MKILIEKEGNVLLLSGPTFNILALRLDEMKIFRSLYLPEDVGVQLVNCSLILDEDNVE